MKKGRTLFAIVLIAFVGLFSLSSIKDRGVVKAAHIPSTTVWAVKSKEYTGRSYGSWRNGPSARGAGTLSFTRQTGYSRSFSGSISGDIPVGKAKLNAAFGVNITSSHTFGTSFSIKIPKNQRKIIIYRPKYKVYRVKQIGTLYIRSRKTSTVSTKYATVRIADGWDYSSKNI
ncbi:hypothetical protein ACFQ4L_06655 [Lapidilactobacillus mulanensis]|uniref:Uncharacterized protein n=1 Tax=Lapidilactobacillus mulanensis TaxID=2485999 RepID=A0ABW4DPK3_9LACO|nr:hypothetical protein [Lapidilactobacillus mulanensis]